MASRKNGEGSYSTITIKGVKYQRYRYPNGKQIYAKTASELRAKKKQYEEDLKEGIIAKSSDLTLYEVMVAWLHSRKNSLEPTSYDNYEYIIRKHFSSSKIGSYQANSITPELISSFFSSLTEKYSQGSVVVIRFVFNSAIKYALATNLISSFDLKAIEMPNKREYKKQKKKIRIATPEDMEKIYNEALAKNEYGHYIHPMACRVLVLIMYSGLRVGEALALRWEDVEKDYSALYVNKTGERIRKRDEKGNIPLHGAISVMVSKRPKTDHSYRTVPLPKRVKDLLRELDESTTHTKQDLVFSYKGHMVCYNSMANALKKMMEITDCEYKDYTIHGLRHTYGSMLIRKGVDIKIVSELLGHSNVAFTYNVYIGVLKEDKVKAVEVLDQI